MEKTIETKKELTPKEIALTMISRPKVRLYSPGYYWFFGLIFGPFPVFLMSYLNSFELPQGEKMQKYLSVLFVIFLCLVSSQVAIVFGVGQEIISLMNQNRNNFTSISSLLDPIKQTEQLNLLSEQLSPMAAFWYHQGDKVFLAAKLLILLILLFFVYKYEKPDYTKLDKNGQVEQRKYRYIYLSALGFFLTVGLIIMIFNKSLM